MTEAILEKMQSPKSRNLIELDQKTPPRNLQDKIIASILEKDSDISEREEYMKRYLDASYESPKKIKQTSHFG